ncbi:MAG: hypothetical protein JJT96_08870 [Opitutales bacterium]|nr:hypothetical protein [Opitutales bacterium]
MTNVFGFGFEMAMKYDYRGRRVEQRYSRTVVLLLRESEGKLDAQFEYSI